MITPIRVILTSRQQCFLDYVKLYSFSKLVRFKVRVHLILGDISVEFGESAVLAWLEKHFLDSEIEVLILNLIQSNVDFVLKTTLVAEIFAITDHLQSKLH